MEAFRRAEGRVVGFHFAGHAEGFRLLLANDQQIEAAGFAKYLGQQEQLKFVFLNACATFGHADLLHQSGIPIAIITEATINDQIARALAVSFYKNLGAGRSILNAFNEYQSKHEISASQSDALRGFQIEDDQGFPWQIRTRPGSENTLHWSLTIASNNHLFNLDLPEDFSHPNQALPIVE